MISMAPNLPPVTLTDEAMKLAATLLQVASDPGGTQARLAELATATQTYRDAIAGHASAKVAADAAAAGLADLQQREQDLANRSEALAAAQTQLQVASSANAARTQALDDAQHRRRRDRLDH